MKVSDLFSKLMYLGHCNGIDRALESYPPHLHFDAPQFAQGYLGVRKPLAELFIELLLHVGGLNILDYTGLQIKSFQNVPDAGVCTKKQ